MDEVVGELYEFAYEKYGEHVVAMRCEGGGLQLFNTVKLFADNNSHKEYERVKDDAAKIAKDIVRRHNAGMALEAQETLDQAAKIMEEL